MGRGTIYNNNLTVDYDKVSTENRKLVKEFLQYCKSSDKSPQTIKQYEEWLKVFFVWNYKENNDKYFPKLKKRDFINYFGYLSDLGLSPNRIISLKSALSSLSNAIELLYEDEEDFNNFHNQLRGLNPIAVTPVRTKTVLTTDFVDKILKELTERGEYQVACFLALVCSSGSRKSEVAQMKTYFFTPEHEVFGGYMYLTDSIRGKGRGKRGKVIKKYVIKPNFQPYFDNWMEERRKLNIDSDFLFITKLGDKYVPATGTTINHFARIISKIANTDFYTHAGRHYFCTMLKKKNLPDDIITQIFSWESSTMVKIYDDTPVEEKLSKYFDENGIKDIKSGD